MPSPKVTFKNSRGLSLSGRLEFPIDRKPIAFCIFAHVFTGNKSLSATRNISRSLNNNGIAVLRFDFTGLGQSEGNFADSNFSTNVDDVLSAATYLQQNYENASLIVGHSLGGAAAIAAAAQLENIRAIATIGTPSEPLHVLHLLEGSLDEIEKTGQAEVTIGGKAFTIKKQFLEDLRCTHLAETISNLRKAILILHSPQDRIVEIENAAKIYHVAHHPKSFVTLDHADHMLSNKDDARYTGDVIASWASRYLSVDSRDELKTQEQVGVRLLLEDGFTTDISTDIHHLVADEPESVGGNDFGPSPYELLNASLGACTAMTLHMYAKRKKWDLQEVRVHLNYAKKHADDQQNLDDPNSKIDHFEKIIEVRGDLDQTQVNRLLEIAKKCPVHKTLSTENRFESRITLLE